MPEIPQSIQSIQSNPLVSNDTLSSGLKFGRFVLSSRQLCSRLFTTKSNAGCLNAANSVIGLAVEKSKKWNLLCKNFLQSPGTDKIQLRSSGEHGGYSTTTLCDAEGKKIEITFPINSCGKTKELGKATAEYEMMHQFVLAMAGPDNSHGVTAAILSEMGVLAHNAAPTRDLAQPGSSTSDSNVSAGSQQVSLREPAGTIASHMPFPPVRSGSGDLASLQPSTSGRQSASEVAAVLLQPRRGVKRKGDELSNDKFIFASKIARWNSPSPKISYAESNNSISDSANGRQSDSSGNTVIIGASNKSVKLLKKPDEGDYENFTEEHVRECANLLEATKEKKGIISRYAREHCLNFKIFKGRVNRVGLTERGEKFLEKQKTKRSTKKLTENLERWSHMSEAERNKQGSPADYARKNGLNPEAFAFYADASGLTEYGKQFLEDQIETVRMTVADLERWLDKPEVERKEWGSIVDFAREWHLNYLSFLCYVDTKGLTKRGVTFLEKNKGVCNPKTAQ